MSRKGVVSTCVRGQTIAITEENILAWLDVTCPQSTDTDLSQAQIDATLLEGNKVGDTPLCRPKQLCDRYRVLHYLYSRNFVNKGKHYTSLTPEDRHILTCIIKGKPFHMGKRIVDKMLRAATLGKKNSELPYPSLVSLILKKNKVWYLEEGEPHIWTEEFGEQALNRMQIAIGNEARTKAAHDINRAGASTPPHAAAATSSHTQRSTPLYEAEAFTAAMEKIVDQTMMKLQSQLEARIGQNEEHVLKLQSYVKEMFEQHVVKLHSYVKDMHEDFGAQMRHMDSTIGHMDSRVSELALDVKDLREFIHLYSTEFKEFAAYKRSHHEEAGPSTHGGNESHSPAHDNVPSPTIGQDHEEAGSFYDTADFSTQSPTTGVPADTNVPEPSSPADRDEADPITPLSIVPLPEPANPPHA